MFVENSDQPKHSNIGSTNGMSLGTELTNGDGKRVTVLICSLFILNWNIYLHPCHPNTPVILHTLRSGCGAVWRCTSCLLLHEPLRLSHMDDHFMDECGWATWEIELAHAWGSGPSPPTASGTATNGTASIITTLITLSVNNKCVQGPSGRSDVHLLQTN